MGPVLAIGGVEVDEVADDQWRAIRSVMREDAQFVDHVVTPDDVSVFWTRFNRWRGALAGFAPVKDYIFDHVFGFVFKWAVIAVSHPVDIQA